jgi:hypothetical protein
MPRLAVAAHDQKVHIASFKYRYIKQGQRSLSSEMHCEFQLTLTHSIFNHSYSSWDPFPCLKNDSVILAVVRQYFLKHSVP